MPGLQTLAIDTKVNQTLYCGTRGCGKTAAQLMFFLQQVGRGYGETFKGILFDDEYKCLEDIKAQGKKFYESLGNCDFKNSPGFYYFEWDTGERLYLRAAKSVQDASKYLGHEYSYVMFNELSKWHHSELYDHMLGTMRIGMMYGAPPTRVFSTTNPYGPGTPWIKRRFIDPKPAGQVMTEDFDVPVGDGKYKRVVKTKVVISGNFTQNPYFREEDIANLMESVRNDPERMAAWLHCDWNAAYVDGAFGDIWQEKLHVVPDFNIPAGWRVDRSFDWGSSTPFAVCWFAESNGEDVVVDGRTMNFPKGSVIMFSEWYGSKDGDLGSNRGLRIGPTAVAKGIKKRQERFFDLGIVNRDTPIYSGPADNQIANVTDPDCDTIKRTMEKEDVSWAVADKSPGSRNQGFNIMRQYLLNSLTSEGAGFYIQSKCRRAIELIPSLAKDGEDIADDQEDHIYDAIRYRLLDFDHEVLDFAFRYR